MEERTENAIKRLIKDAEKNLEKAVERLDYSAAARAESYLNGLEVALEVIRLNSSKNSGKIM